MVIATNQLLDAAVKTGLVKEDLVKKLQVDAKRNREDVLEMITNHGQFPVTTLYRAYAENKRIPFVDLNTVNPIQALVERLPESLLRRRLVLPIDQKEGKVIVATSDPNSQTTADMVQKILHQPVQLVLAEPISLRRLIDQTLQSKSGGPLSGTEDSEVVMDKLMKEAFLRRASDIHLEPQEDTFRIRLRIDGALQILNLGLNVSEGTSLISRIKVLSDLDIAEHRMPQDGGFTYEVPQQEGRKIDLRVATSPTRWGERATLRLLGMETDKLTLHQLGMQERDLEQFNQLIKKPYGVILLTGPTGSGKTTTLYGALRAINDPQKNIMTIEDPIEYVVAGINQFQVGASTKSTFATALRSLLRHDPDVLMVGEIRDYETADVALKASLTGHLVFSTLHTNSSYSAVTRLLDIGCERYLIGSSLTGVIAQRLVRRLCLHCRQEKTISEKEAKILGVKEKESIFEPKGCVHCLGTGYHGRVGLYECLWLDEDMRNLIARGCNERELFEKAKKSGLTTLRKDGYNKVLEGVTSLEEVLLMTVDEC